MRGNETLMKAAPAVLICVTFAGCGDEKQQDRVPAAREAATPEKSEDAQAELREVFDGYYDALEARDWDAACERMAPESITKLRESVRVLTDANPPEECWKLWDELYTGAGEQLTKQLIDEMVKTAELDSVNVTGDTATLKWHFTDEGERQAVTQPARRITGEWKLVDEVN
jgi:hypothetical protein